MSMVDEQSEFSRKIGVLIIVAHELGFEVTLGHALRCEECHTGKPHSLHKRKLAVDLNLFIGGKYLTDTEDHRPLGELWEQMGGTWGGRWGDGNHYSWGEG